MRCQCVFFSANGFTKGAEDPMEFQYLHHVERKSHEVRNEVVEELSTAPGSEHRPERDASRVGGRRIRGRASGKSRKRGGSRNCQETRLKDSTRRSTLLRGEGTEKPRAALVKPWPNRVRWQSVRAHRTVGLRLVQKYRNVHCEPAAVPT